VGSKCRDRRKKIGENGRIPGGSYLKSKKGGETNQLSEGPKKLKNSSEGQKRMRRAGWRKSDQGKKGGR
jgi:hypothetical protein